MASSINLANESGRNATVGLHSVKALPAPEMGVPNKRVVFRRYLSTAESGSHDALAARFGPNYAQALIDGDPEIDIEVIGVLIEQTQTVYLDGDGSLMFIEPSFIEIIFSADGSEKERKAPLDVTANINSELPVRWTGRKVSINEAVRRFSFKRSIQLQHVDGLTYDFLYAMAKDLEASNSLVIVGCGDKGSAPLIFQSNGRPYRGFLRGQTNGKAYRLILHLSDLELKKPYTFESQK
jgi:hypothetical protein